MHAVSARSGPGGHGFKGKGVKSEGLLFFKPNSFMEKANAAALLMKKMLDGEIELPKKSTAIFHRHMKDVVACKHFIYVCIPCFDFSSGAVMPKNNHSAATVICDFDPSPTAKKGSVTGVALLKAALIALASNFAEENKQIIFKALDNLAGKHGIAMADVHYVKDFIANLEIPQETLAKVC